MRNNQRKRLTAVANHILRCKPLAGQAVQQALWDCRRLAQKNRLPAPPPTLCLVRVRQIACRYFRTFYGKPFSQPGWSYVTWDSEQPVCAADRFLVNLPPSDMDLLLLCADRAVPRKAAAELLDMPLEQMKARWTQILAAMERENIDVAQLCGRIAAYRPAKRNENRPAALQSKKGAVSAKTKKASRAGAAHPHAWIASGLIFLELATVSTTAGVVLWYANHRQPAAASALDTGGNRETSPFDMRYAIEPPPGFQRTEFLWAARTAYDQYENGAGGMITFTQTIAEHGAKASQEPTGQPFAFKGHPAFISVAGAEIKVAWNQELCHYELTTNLSQAEAISLAESAVIAQPAPSLQKIPLECLPYRYTERLALENNDVILGRHGPRNTQLLLDFYEDFQAGREGSVRIVTFSDGDFVTVADLQTRDHTVDYAADSRRTNSPEPWITGARYDGLRMETENGYRKFFLDHSEWDAPLEVASFADTDMTNSR